jgi:hypothetical protein
MSIKSIIALSIVFIGLVAVPSAYANKVLEKSFREKFEESDLIVIGVVREIGLVTDAEYPRTKSARVEVEAVLKGEDKKTIFVAYVTGNPEFDPVCCTVDKRYIFFLEGGKLVSYDSVNGRFGIYRLTGEEDQH